MSKLTTKLYGILSKQCGTEIKACIKQMSQNRECRNKPLHIYSNDFQQGWQDHSRGKVQFFQLMVLGKLDTHKQKNEVGPLTYHHIQKLTKIN